MNVLCLYHERSHAAPLMRCHQELQQRGITMTFTECNSFAKAAHHIHFTYDALVVHQVLLSNEVFACGPPVVILERIDGAQIAGSRPWMSYAAGVIKGYTFRDRQLNNQISGRRFPHLLVEAGIGPEHNTRALAGTPEPQLTEEQLGRIQVGYGFASYDVMRDLIHYEPKWDLPRAIDLNCIAFTEYKGTEIELHRKQAIEVAQGWSGPMVCGAGRPYPHDEYIALLKQSKAVLSPWGWGEPCYRDYEAILAGAVLIKPNTDYVEGWPDIYQEGITYRACKADLSDVHEIVGDIIARWDEHLEMRQKARRMVWQAWQPVNIAARMAGILKGVVK